MTHEALRRAIETAPAILVYYSTPDCGVCTVLRPKVEELIRRRFPSMSFLYVNAEESPEAAAQESVFAVPTVVAYFGGREHVRKSRHFGLDELAAGIERPYEILFSS